MLRSPSHVSLVVAILLASVLLVSQLTASHVQVDGLLGDLWVETDAIWRSWLGQRPNHDFITPVGPLFYAVYRLPLLFEPPSLAVMVHANLLMGLVAALLAYGVGRRSIGWEALALLMALAFLTAASGRAIGTPLAAQSVPYIVPYNRWCWALSIPCALGLLIPRENSPRLPFALIGLALAAIFFIKLSFFVGLCGLAGAAFLVDIHKRAARSEAIGRALTLGVSLVVCLGVGALVFGISDYFQDVRMVAEANFVAFRLVKFALQLPEACLMFGFAIIIYRIRRGRDPVATADLIKIGLMIGCGVAIMSENHENNEAPLYFASFIAAYVLGGYSSKQDEPDSFFPREHQKLISFSLMLLLLLVPMTADAGTAAIAGLRTAAKPGPAIPQFQNTMLADLRSTDTDEISRVLDGLDLLRRVGQSGHTVLPLIMGNPFSALTGTRSPRGALAIWFYGRTFSETHYPPPEVALGDADFVLARRDDATSLWLSRLYAQSISANYQLAGESRYWVAWRRRDLPK